MKTAIVPINFIEDLEAIMSRDKCNAVGIEQMSITYTQPADTNCSADEIQHLTVTTDSACCSTEDDPEAFYFNLTIPEGEHWSVYDEDNLKAVIEDFKKRLYLTTKHYDTKGED